jgi:TldD protein
VRDILSEAIEEGLKFGGNFIDIRLEDATFEGVEAEDGQPKESSFAVERGVGARALAGGSWGFSASRLVEGYEAETIRDTVLRAVKLAKAVKPTSQPEELAEARCVQEEISACFTIDPTSVSVEEKMDDCVEASQRMLNFDSAIKKAVVAISSIKLDKLFCSSEGSYIKQEQVFTFGNLYANALKEGNSEIYAHTEGGSRGFEVLKEYDLVEKSEDIAQKALNLAGAKAAPTIESPVVLDQDFVALLVHEVVGHPSEADRVLGKEAAWAGRAWWTDKVGEQIFSEKLNIVSDATLDGYLGSFKYDDEGIPAKRVVHIEQGCLKEFLHSRATAKKLGTEPNGAMRAAGYLYAPLIRMTNTFLESGDHKLDEIFEGFNGYYLKGGNVPSIDSRRYNFKISAKEAYRVEKGEIKAPLRGAALTGTSKDFLSGIEAVGNDLLMVPIPNCGKGDPMQVMRVGNGGPHIKGIGIITGPR